MLSFTGVSDFKMREEVKALHRHYMSKLEQFTDIVGGMKIEVKLSSSMRTNGGTATYRTNHIQLNYRLFVKNPDYLKQTYGHELAHLVSYWIYGRDGMGHKHKWQSIMKLIGLKAKRCHKMKVKKAKWKRYPVYCGCSKPHRLTRTKYLNVERYRCGICKEQLSTQKPMAVAACGAE